jgi:hypothetical protein
LSSPIPFRFCSNFLFPNMIILHAHFRLLFSNDVMCFFNAQIKLIMFPFFYLFLIFNFTCHSSFTLSSNIQEECSNIKTKYRKPTWIKQGMKLAIPLKLMQIWV